MSTKNNVQLNGDINSYRVVLVDASGVKRGEFLRDDAIDLAKEDGLDLVMVGTGPLPICKIMDYGKFVYQQKKRKTKAPVTKLKEIKLTPVTDRHDFEVRLNRARDFLNKGHKVKVTIVMKGRHRRYQDQGFDMCLAFHDELKDVSQIDGSPQMAGRYITMILSRISSS